MAKAQNHRTNTLSMQRLWLAMGCINMLLCYIVPSPPHWREVNLVAAAWLLFLYTRVGRWSVDALAVLASLAGYVLLLFSTVPTGGINSSAMVWFTFLPVAMLTVQGPRQGLIWLGICSATGLALYLFVALGWMSPALDQTPASIAWALTLVAGVMITQHLIVTIYARVDAQQLAELEANNSQLERAQAALIQAQSHKDEFIASMGHELRTPMNAILGLNNVLQSELEDRQEDLHLAELIRTSTEQLLRLVNDILLLSQLEASRVNLRTEAADIRALLRQWRDKWTPAAQARGLILAIECDDDFPRWVRLDVQRIDQILHQLLDNAIKFTQQGYVSVRVSAASDSSRQGRRFRVDVQDTGVGIAHDKLGAIFNRFEQADLQTNRAFGGTGIGLSIAQRLVGLHGSTLRVQSEIGKGTHFWFEWPLEIARAPAPSEELSVLLAPRLLIVDDDPVNRKLTQKAVLSVWPRAQVGLVSGGESALQWLHDHEADVVLLDRMMPRMDGLETARRIRNSGRREVAEVAILGLTAYDDDAEHQRCIQAGMDAVASKPIRPDALKTHIVQVLMQRQVRLTRNSS